VVGGQRGLEAEALDRDGAAVHAPQHPGALQDGQVLADRLRGDAGVLGQADHLDAAVRAGALGDLLLPLFRVDMDSPPFRLVCLC
jgi:hypothetical protein